MAAGNWIKMTHSLRTAPEVVRISSALKADRLSVIGALYVLWSIADNHADEAGNLPDYTAEILDSELGWPGFAEAVCNAGWLRCSDKSVSFPHFERHNGKSAKRRALDASRKGSVRKKSALQTDKKRNRERERERVSPYTPLFEKMWDAYPMKDGKKSALRHFAATVQTDEDVGNIRQALRNYLAHLSRHPDKPAKNGSTWFNNWRDWVEFEEPQQGNSGPTINPRTGKRSTHDYIPG